MAAAVEILATETAQRLPGGPACRRAGPLRSEDGGGLAAALCVVVPVYNEQEVLLEFHRRLSVVLDALDLTAEVIYVNDGSGDFSLYALQKLRRLRSRR